MLGSTARCLSERDDTPKIANGLLAPTPKDGIAALVSGTRKTVEQTGAARLHERGLAASGAHVRGVPRRGGAAEPVVVADDGAIGVDVARPVVSDKTWPPSSGRGLAIRLRAWRCGEVSPKP
jgi:hypothetical protein